MSNCRSCQHADGGWECKVTDGEDFDARSNVSAWSDVVEWDVTDDGVWPVVGSATCPCYSPIYHVGPVSPVVAVTLNDLINDAHQTAVSKGWWDDGDRNLYEQVALMHSELSEAVEELRAGRGVTEVYFNEDKPDKPEGFPIELADVLIRIFDTACRYGIDLPAAIDMKLKYNKSRPYRHGGKKA